MWPSLVLLVAVLLLVPRVAEATQTEAFTLQVSQSMAPEGTASAQGVSVGYSLTPQGSGAPMPDGSAGGAYRFSVTGNGAAAITWSNLSVPGRYRYAIEPEGVTAGEVTSSPERIDLLLVVTDDAGAPEVQAAAYYPDGKKGELRFTRAMEDGGSAGGGGSAGATSKGGITPRTGDSSTPLDLVLLVMGLSGASFACSYALSRESRRGSEEIS